MKKYASVIFSVFAFITVCIFLRTYTAEEKVHGENTIQAPEDIPKTEEKVNIDTDTEKENTSPQPETMEKVYTLSFVGDCTLGTEYASYGSAGSFVAVVGDNYDYPFANVADYFSNDDLTFANLEGAFTDSTEPVEKQYRFKGPKEYAKILTAGSVELVNLANNHSGDYGEKGYSDTKSALEAEGVDYVEKNGKLLYTTESGLKVGIYSSTWSNCVNMKSSIESLREEGAEIIIASFHWGIEGYYGVTYEQTVYAHNAIDYGANIVFGHHPHVLEKIEEYNGGVIYYSLGNFSFGGNRNPVDKDTAIIQQKVIRDEEGNVSLGETEIIPCCISDTTERNTYKPTPYEQGTAAYDRVLSKLDGSYAASHPQDLTPKEEKTEDNAQENNPQDTETEISDGQQIADTGEGGEYTDGSAEVQENTEGENQSTDDILSDEEGV